LFYVGINSSSSGNKILSLKTENVNNAAKIAKEKFHDWFQKHKMMLNQKILQMTLPILISNTE
jgi:Fe-S cluster biosynthesis and repair protein YggX